MFHQLYISSAEIPAEFKTDILADKAAAIVATLLENNAKFNLTAITAPEEVLHKHILDSLLAAQALRALLPPQTAAHRATLLDVGSGAGFPSLPIAAALPELSVTALDATAKKCAHMRSAAAAAELGNFRAVSGRAEELAHDGMCRERFDFVTARAVANLPVLAELCLPFVRVGGVFLAMKGKSAPDELAAAAQGIARLGGKCESSTQYFVPGDDAPRYFLTIRKISATPAAYPRQYAQITKKPL